MAAMPPRSVYFWMRDSHRQAKERDIATDRLPHLIHQVVVGVEDGITFRQYAFGYDTFTRAISSMVLDVFQTQVISATLVTMPTSQLWKPRPISGYHRAAFG